MADRIPTLADICSAIAEGHVVASSDGFAYHVSARELRRYFGRSHTLPTISTTAAQDSTPHSDSDTWSPSSKTSVA